MARFDVYQFDSPFAALVVDVQAEVLEDLVSRVVVPLVPLSKAGNESLPRLQPKVVVDGTDYILMTTDLAALPRARFGPHVANIDAAHRDEITNALDFLLYGF